MTTLQIAGVSGVGLGWDKINVKPTGTLTLSSLGNIFVDGTGYTAAVGDTFDLLDWTTLVNNGFSAGTNNRTGGLGGGNLDLPTLTGGLTWNVNNFLTTGAISVTAVPEPSRVILLFLGIGSLLLRRRRA